jgi:hypothetical protein
MKCHLVCILELSARIMMTIQYVRVLYTNQTQCNATRELEKYQHSSKHPLSYKKENDIVIEHF